MSGRADDPAVARSPEGYIRGGGGVEVSRQRLLAVLLGAAVVVLLVLAAVLAAGAAAENDRVQRLQSAGVPVEVTVSSCFAMASGTGITEYGYQCRGTFTLAGRHYQERLGGTTEAHQPGDSVQAIVVPADPAILYPAATVAGMRSTWTRFAAPAVLVLLAVVAAAVVRRRRRPHRP